eukprot:TRINITY_DN10647_c0_g1_i1.p1 TRINITY_DN10647_c0_g1~~TRINITY_DN10647_c0_g1_i1.p1  ORF type:complete len:421 (-),score=31.35 TRINITY_DN10647_c0_g1_i1:50-1312(-)
MVTLLGYITFGLIFRPCDGKNLIRSRSVASDGALGEGYQNFTMREVHTKSGGCKHFLTHDAVTANSGNYHNTWDGHGKTDCGNNQAIVSMFSHHSNRHEDRGWKIHCRGLKGAGASLSGCRWSGYTGYDATWDEPKSNDLEVIAGVESQHHNRREDRQYKFKYCRVNGVSAVKTWWDGNWRNGWDGDMTMQTHGTDFIRRVNSEHHNRHEDRVFKFMQTQFCLNPINCVVSQWASWGGCSKPCAGGSKARARKVTSAQQNGGSCVGLSESTGCNTHPCAINCEMNPWNAWSNCDLTCGGGKSKRARSVKTQAAHGGTACPPQNQWNEEKACNEAPCPIDCVLNEWVDWKPCPTCYPVAAGVPLTNRSRTIATQPEHGGVECEAMAEERDCFDNETQKCHAWRAAPLLPLLMCALLTFLKA